MLDSIRRTMRNLRSHTCGNATLLLALGMPAMVGGAGLAVDTAQWYMWKRELQFAVDQAALAGAWARSSRDATVQATYSTRATQEYATNISMVKDFDTPPTVALANHGTGIANSVLVTVTASEELPFSSFLTGRSTTVFASAKATFTSGTTHTACMLAVDPTADSAFRFGGSVSGSSACGAGTLSNDENAAMKEVGNTDVSLGKLIATGGIDDGFADNGTIYANQGGLSDPFASLATPSTRGSTSKTYTCLPPSAAYTTADITTHTVRAYKYYNKVGNVYTLNPIYNGTYKQANYDNNPGSTLQDQTVTSTTNSRVGPTESDYVKHGVGQNTIYEKTTTTVDTSYSDIRYNPAHDGIARPTPGIYASIIIACPTIFSSGIYFISGGIDFGQNKVVTGSGVLFVLTGNSGSIAINSNSSIALSGILPATLTSAPYNFDTVYATKLARMLFFDKRSSSSFTLNGSSTLHLEGNFYMPGRDANFLGDSYATGNCMMVVARKIDIQGNFDISNFCTPTGTTPLDIGGGTPTVKLVA